MLPQQTTLAETTVTPKDAPAEPVRGAEPTAPETPAGRPGEQAPATDQEDAVKNEATNAEEPEEAPASEPETEGKEVPKEELDAILRHHVWGAMGVGLIPVPVVDLLALTGVQVNLLHKLAEAYEVPFFKDTVKNLLSALVGSALPVAAAPGFASIVKAIPLIGQTMGGVAMSLIGGAATYAIGKVFIRHFASGGTFLTFNPEKVRAYYMEMLEEGKQFVTKLKK